MMKLHANPAEGQNLFEEENRSGCEELDEW